MNGLSIGEVATRAGIAPSAIRYYESLGLLPEPSRAGGKRRYDETVLGWLALIALAQEAGFTMAETRELIDGFEPGTLPATRWQALATRKLAEIDEQIARANRMRQVLKRGLACGCLRLEECAQFLDLPVPAFIEPPRKVERPSKTTRNRGKPRKAAGRASPASAQRRSSGSARRSTA